MQIFFLALLVLLYLYGTCKYAPYIDSNFLSRVKLATVLIFSMASVAICNRNTNVSNVLIKSYVAIPHSKLIKRDC